MNITDKFHPYGCQGVTVTTTSAAIALNAGIFAAPTSGSGIQGTGQMIRLTNEDATNKVRFMLGNAGAVAISTVGATMSPCLLPLQSRMLMVIGDTHIAVKTDAATAVLCIETGEGTD